MPRAIFNAEIDRYEALIDWPKRMANEGPFYRRLFEGAGVKCVLDAACGTGHHAEMFHSWGLRVEGADLSVAMIELCRARLGGSRDLRWVARSFDRPSEPPGSFDAVICVGNSLSLADDAETIDRAIGAMLQSARPGGLCIIHVLNVWSVPEGPILWQKHKRARLDNREHVLLKGIRRSGGRAWVEIVDLADEQGDPDLWSESVSFAGLEASRLTEIARTAGALTVEVHGSYSGAPYQREKSTDIILVCRK
jgi:SAM-dependent methyltransferase